LAHAEASLPPRDAASFGAAIRRDAPHYAQAAQQLTEARQEFWRQVTAEQFNQYDVRQALDAWRTAWNRFLDDFSSTIVAALAEVSPEGRRKLMAERRFQLSRPVIEVPAPR
jgi:Heavy-metal resistance